MADSRGWIGDLLASVQAASPVKSVEVMARLLREEFSATEVTFLITDLGGSAVVQLTGFDEDNGPGEPQPLPLAGTVYDRVIRSQQLWVDDLERTPDDQRPSPTRVIAPVSDRGDTMGLLELDFPAAPDHRMLQRISEAARVLAYVVIANKRFTDLYEWGRRTTRMSLASEIQHRLLPESFTCDAGPFTVAGALEPAANIGGDTFDYALNRRGLHLSLTDAMGHDVRAAQLATVVVSALRNARRAGLGLAAQAKAANVAVAEHAIREHRAVVEESEQVHHALAEHGAQAMATGQLLWVSFETGNAVLVNAGHVWPLLLRQGEVEEIRPIVDLPFGVDPEQTYHVQTLDLRPGDRLVLVTDGMLEPDGSSHALRQQIVDTGTQHPRDAVRTFTRSVLEATEHDPRDDATVLCLEWSGTAWSRRHD
ncbi:MAG TPA: PP2C family protein-serine/threonine phosphatase [Streptomyces sp.]|nr:PP2C family protein-serine/threonine phosphatase [Streptomyces sp.]